MVFDNYRTRETPRLLNSKEDVEYVQGGKYEIIVKDLSKREAMSMTLVTDTNVWKLGRNLGTTKRYKRGVCGVSVKQG